jgi:hypothetical protein
MTRSATWANSDSLTVGFGKNFAEREAAGVLKTEGVVKEARVSFTHESTFGESSTYIQLPKNVVVLSAHLRVDALWTSSDASLSIGHTEADSADVSAFMTITQGDHGSTKLGAAAGTVLTMDGTYFKDTNAVKIPAVLTKDYDTTTIGVKVFITSTEGVAWTTGEATLIVRYVELGY